MLISKQEGFLQLYSTHIVAGDNANTAILFTCLPPVALSVQDL